MPQWIEVLTIVGLAALPVSELRGAIPLALFQFQFDPWLSFGLAVLGNMLPVPLLLLGLNRLIAFCQRFPFPKKMLAGWMVRTQRKHSKNFKRFGAVALILFVAIPFPATGAWTGSLAAVLFGIPFRFSLPLIGVGVLIAGVIVTFTGLGILALGQ